MKPSAASRYGIVIEFDEPPATVTIVRAKPVEELSTRGFSNLGGVCRGRIPLVEIWFMQKLSKAAILDLSLLQHLRVKLQAMLLILGY